MSEGLKAGSSTEGKDNGGKEVEEERGHEKASEPLDGHAGESTQSKNKDKSSKDKIPAVKEGKDYSASNQPKSGGPSLGLQKKSRELIDGQKVIDFKVKCHLIHVQI